MKDLEPNEVTEALTALEGRRIKAVKGLNVFDGGLYGVTLIFDDGSFIRFEAVALHGMEAVIAVANEQ